MPVTACQSCGATFGCNPQGECWCMSMAVKLPMPEPGSTVGCLCPACLQAKSSEAKRLAEVSYESPSS